MEISSRPIKKISLALAFLVAGFSARATTVIGPWVPAFKGVDYSVSTNIPSGGNLPRLQVVHAFRVDLTDPDIRLLTTPPISNYVAGSSEVGGLTTSDFLTTNHLQAAINANFFAPGGYYLPAGTPMDVFGLSVSEGVVVSTQDGPNDASAILFDTNNVPTLIPTNWPAVSTNGIYTAISGNRPLVLAGTNIANQGNPNDLDPRTLFGISQDRRFLYLVGIDGRQPGYSDGSNDRESAEWLLLLGAYEGINVDGGGSTLLVIEDTTGVPIRLSQSSAVADSGLERTVGSHFGLYAKPLPGFINDVVAQPDDTTAEITWTTVEPSTTEVQYGLTTNFGSSSGLQSAPVTNHVVQLSGLTPETGYYFRALSSVGTQEYVSSNYFFVTINHVTTNRVLEITNSWKYTITNLNGASWTTTNYNDSAWSGPGAGLLWVDVRAAGPNPAVQPKGTQMPANPNNGGNPYITYYFRAHFGLTNIVQGGSLAFSGYIDDGAIFYINGMEIYRLRMPTDSDSTTLASTNNPCVGGDAICLDQFRIPMASITNLALGDNVLSAEVHNRALNSPDITFGISMERIEPIANPLPSFIYDVAAQPIDTTAEITWTTIEPSTSEVQYGVTTNLGSTSALQPANVTNHVVQLTGLTPDTGYYFRALSSVGAQEYASSNFFFVTTNVTTNVVMTNRVEITSSWKYTSTNLNGINWAGTNYNDSAWSGPGAGLLWVDLRPEGVNTNVAPKGTQLPPDPDNPDFPSVTYYFRTHVVLTNIVQGGSLAFSGYIDDGAVFYLNGAEIYRLRMPTNSDSATLATTNTPCVGGDATCLDEFKIPMASLTNLAVGDNVLAVEVHNSATNSTDITFGISMEIEPVVPIARIDISFSGNTITLSWDASDYILQSVDSLEGQWTNVQGTAGSPFTVEPLEAKRFYRLKK
jgi:hypothetical protein